jgi:hypothetical protein
VPKFQAPLDIGGRDCPPNYKHVLFVGGDFFPVTNMFDSEREPTGNPDNAFTVVVFAGPNLWRVYSVSPGEVEHREDFERRLGRSLELRK